MSLLNNDFDNKTKFEEQQHNLIQDIRGVWRCLALLKNSFGKVPEDIDRNSLINTIENDATSENVIRLINWKTTLELSLTTMTSQVDPDKKNDLEKAFKRLMDPNAKSYLMKLPNQSPQ